MADGITMVGGSTRGWQGRGRGTSPQGLSPQEVVARAFDRSSRFQNEWRGGGNGGGGGRWNQGFGMERGNGTMLNMNMDNIKNMIGQIARTEMAGVVTEVQTMKEDMVEIKEGVKTATTRHEDMVQRMTDLDIARSKEAANVHNALMERMERNQREMMERMEQMSDRAEKSAGEREDHNRRKYVRRPSPLSSPRDGGGGGRPPTVPEHTVTGDTPMGMDGSGMSPARLK